MTKDRVTNTDRQRDASSLFVLGLFFTVLGVLVLIGTVWTRKDMHAAVVNASSGLVLVAVGIGTIGIGRRMARRKGNDGPSDAAPPR